MPSYWNVFPISFICGVCSIKFVPLHLLTIIYMVKNANYKEITHFLPATCFVLSLGLNILLTIFWNALNTRPFPNVTDLFHTHTHTPPHTNTYTLTHTPSHTHPHAHPHTHPHAHTPSRTHILTHTHPHAHTHTLTNTHTHKYIYIYMQTRKAGKFIIYS
jgi:hypothetical protein